MRFKTFKHLGILTILFVIALAGVGLYLYLDIPKIKTPELDSVEIVLDQNIDWNSVDIEVSSILSDLIQIPTVRSQESKAAIYLQRFLQREGIPTKLIPHPERPDKISVIAELGPEESVNGIVLLSHLDVVEANKDEWSFDPFSGEVTDGLVRGRGALDMKGMTSMELLAFILVHRNNIKLKNKIMFLAVPDEEDGGKYGAQFLLNQHEDLFAGYQYVINEGGFGIVDFPKPGNKIFNIQTAEKGILGLEVTAQSASGHGSMPDAKSASLELSRFLLEVQELQKFKLTQQALEFFHRLSHFFQFPEGFLLRRIQNPIVQWIVGPKLRDNRTINAMVTDTISITSLESNTKTTNVIPSESKAYLDIRLLPGVSPEEFTSEVRKIAEKYQVVVDVKESFASSQSSAQSPLYDIIHTVIHDNVPDAEITPYLSPGVTDSRFFRQKNFECYGIIPILITMEDVAKLHGKNESVSLENLMLGTKIIFETLVGFNHVESL